MSGSPYPELVELQSRLSGLPHLKQNMLRAYALYGGLEGPVEKTAADLARLVGIAAPHFSRARRELEQEGWLEYTHSEGQVKFFRLGEKATGRTVVVSMRHATR
ncbi:hypothetical protein ACFCZ6_14445 [Streptomyces hydrogenans]|uniref:hypothetical protein n=1 Tax=Streptomyces hydrogenans TaxID=1873719 RepID=UPI0035DFE3C5